MRIRAGHLVTLLLIMTSMAPAASALVATDFAGSEANNCPSLPCTNAGELVFTLPSLPVKMWVTPNNNYLYVGENGYVNLNSLSATGLQGVWELPVDLYGVISSAAYDPVHELLALSNATGVAIVDVGPAREVMQFINTTSAVVDVAWDPDGEDTTGDGLIAALQVLAVIVESGKPASEICRVFEPLPQVLKNVQFNGGKPLEDKVVKKAIADGEVRLGKTGRLLVRPSGTEPVIRVMAEGEDEALVESVVGDIAVEIERAGR